MKHENPWDNTSAIGAYPLLLIAAVLALIVGASWLCEKATKALDDLLDALRGFVLSTVQKNRSNTQ